MPNTGKTPQTTPPTCSSGLRLSLLGSNPTPDDGDDIPIFPKWDPDERQYMAFRADGAFVEQDYPLTYNKVMRDTLTTSPDSTTQRTTEETTTRDPPSSGAEAIKTSSYVTAGITLLALLSVTLR